MKEWNPEKLLLSDDSTPCACTEYCGDIESTLMVRHIAYTRAPARDILLTVDMVSDTKTDENPPDEDIEDEMHTDFRGSSQSDERKKIADNKRENPEHKEYRNEEYQTNGQSECFQFSILEGIKPVVETTLIKKLLMRARLSNHSLIYDEDYIRILYC